MHTMPPKKKVKRTLANCWANPELSTSASIPPPIDTLVDVIRPREPQINENALVRHTSGSMVPPGWKCIHCRHILPSVFVNFKSAISPQAGTQNHRPKTSCQSPTDT